MKGINYQIAVLAGWALLALSSGQALATKDQSRLPGAEPNQQGPAGFGGPPLTQPGQQDPSLLQLQPGDQTPESPPDEQDETEPAIEVAPTLATVETIELTADIAKRAIDGFVRLKENYQDTDIAEYQSLEDFVAKAEQGPALEKDVKSFGFASVGEWNTAITSVSFAYAAVTGTQEDEIRQELENIKADADMDAAMKKSLIEGLESMLPSGNNKKIVAELNKDRIWAEKLKLLTEEEGGRDH